MSSVIPSNLPATIAASVILTVAPVISLWVVSPSLNTCSHCYMHFYFVLELSVLKEEKLLVGIDPFFNGLVLALPFVPIQFHKT